MNIKGLDYNTQREKLIMSEYGREIQKMIEYACELPTKEERLKCAKTIIRQMSDSLEYYKAKCDSLYSAKQDTFYIPYPVERELNNAEKRYISIGKVSVGVYVGLVLALIAWLVYYFKRKKK